MSEELFKEVPISQGVEELASINMTTSDDDVLRVQCETLNCLTGIIPLGQRHGIQYEIRRWHFEMLCVDPDHEKHIPVPLE